MAARALAVGVELDGEGAHPAAWRFAGHPPTAWPDPERLAAQARAVERAGFAFAWLAAHRPWDGTASARDAVSGRLDPVETASFLAAHTARLGLVVETDVVGAEPFHLANRLASLDWATRGRAGWAPVLPSGQQAETVAEHAAVVDAVRALWDTWEDGVLLADEATGRFLDLDRWHYADVDGPWFSIKGPSITPRPPQGHLPVLGAGPGVDVVRVAGADVDEVAARAQAARAAGAVRVLADVEVLLDADVPAQRRLAALDAHAPWAPAGALRVVGTPDDLLDALVALAPHVDAVRLDPAVHAVDVPVVARRVLPRLAAGRGTRLRDVLGLGPAGNRFTDRRRGAEERGDAA